MRLSLNNLKSANPLAFVKAKKTILVILLGIVCVTIFTLVLPPSIDWDMFYRPAVVSLVNGRSPYEIDRFLNPPWVLIPMIPLLLFPVAVSRAILAFCALITLAYVSHKLGAKLISSVFFLLSPPVIQLMLDGNIDWLTAIGFILPPQLGLFFVTLKPQIGVCVIIFWLIESWRKNGLREVFRVFWPVTAAYLLSFAIFGFWPIDIIVETNWGGNASLWPMSIPIGLALLVTAIRKQNLKYAMAASPCLSPYVLLHSWIGPLLAIGSALPETIAAVAGMWVLVIIRAVGS